jgi:S-(hydroxymethyl)mycothiol dehydrogenase
VPGLQARRPHLCFDIFNATQKMTLTDGTELSSALGIGAVVEKTLVHEGRCTKVDPKPTRRDTMV